MPMLTAALFYAPPYPQTVLRALGFFPDPRKIPALNPRGSSVHFRACGRD